MGLKKRLLTLLMTALFLVPIQAAAAEKLPFEKGTPGSWYAFCWSNNGGADNIYIPFMLHSNNSYEYTANLRGGGPIATARRMKAYFDKLPDGKRALNPFSLYAPIRDLDNKIAGNFFWPDESYNEVCRELDEVLFYYKRLGGKPIDAFVSDLESGMTIWNLEAFQIKGIITLEEMFDGITEDPRYETELRPSIIEAGITLYEGNDHNELYNMYANRNLYGHNSPEKADVYKGVRWAQRRTAQYLNKVYDVLKKYYPDIKCSDYDCYEVAQPNKKTTAHGHMYGLFSETVPVEEREFKSIMGTHSSWSNYGDVQAGLTSSPPPGYPYATYQNTPFNGILYQIISMQNAVTYREDSKIQPWVGCYTFGYADLASYPATDWYDELIYQFAMGNPDPFLFFNVTKDVGINENEYFSQLLHDLDDIAGFEDRKSLITELTPWDSHYILNGMNAGGKNIWRITPDLFVEGMTIENFKLKDNPLTFRIAEQIVEFPEGSYIYDPGKGHSKCGYWVISPEGTRPEERRDASIKPAVQPDYTWDKAKAKEIIAERVAAVLSGKGVTTEIKPLLPTFSKSYRDVFKKAINN